MTLAYMNIDYSDLANPLLAWVFGSLVGVTLIALFSDIVFKGKLLFLPIICFVAV